MIFQCFAHRLGIICTSVRCHGDGTAESGILQRRCGTAGIVVLLATTKPLVGRGYLYPLIPFNGKALWRLLVREPISRHNT